MISLYDGELADILPDNLKNVPEYQAISYALKKAGQKLIKYAAKASVFSSIDDLDEDMVDLLAVELRAQYYEQSFDLDTKKNIVKQAILWNVKAGTKYAIDNVIQTIYGGGEEADWYEYGGTPGHFIITLEAIKTYDFTKIVSIIEKIKRKSAVLDKIELILRAQHDLYFGTITSFQTEIKLKTAPVDIGKEYTWYTDEYGTMLEDQNGNVMIE